MESRGVHASTAMSVVGAASFAAAAAGIAWDETIRNETKGRVRRYSQSGFDIRYE